MILKSRHGKAPACFPFSLPTTLFLVLIGSGMGGCNEKLKRGQAESCTGKDRFPSNECPPPAEYQSTWLANPECGSETTICYAENVVGPRPGRFDPKGLSCCYGYTIVHD